MIRADVISINPCAKTLGELHHPEGSGAAFYGSLNTASEKAVKSHRWHLLFCAADMKRPAVSLLIFRLLFVALMSASLLAMHTPYHLWLIAIIGAMIVAGIGTRVLVVPGMAAVFLPLLSAGNAPEFALFMSMGVAVAGVGILLGICGSGRLSIDCLLWRRREEKIS